MGWASGASLMDDIIGDMLQYPVLTFEIRKLICSILIENFENHDADTLEECMYRDSAYDTAIKEYHPDWEFCE